LQAAKQSVFAVADLQKREFLTHGKKVAAFCKKRRKNFFCAGPWALAAPAPMAQHSKVFLLLFVHKK
jgi:hypothetical protein